MKWNRSQNYWVWKNWQIQQAAERSADRNGINFFQIKARLNYTMTYLNNNGKNEEISNLATRYNEAVSRWKEDIANSPEGSPDINFGKYFSI